MESEANQERRQAHALLDLLPTEKVNAVRNLLEVMVEPLARSLTDAATEQEDITPETAETIESSRRSLARGEGIPHEKIRREVELIKSVRAPRPSASALFGPRKRATACEPSTAKRQCRSSSVLIASRGDRPLHDNTRPDYCQARGTFVGFTKNQLNPAIQ